MAREAEAKPLVCEDEAPAARMMGAAYVEEPETPMIAVAEPPMLAATPADPNPLIVDVADMARRMGMDPATLTPQQTSDITDAIVDAQADTEGMLNRPIVPTIHTLMAVYPRFGYDLEQPAAWQHLEERFDDVIRVIAMRDRLDGTYDVDVQVGLDGRAERALVRYVRAHAIESLRLNPSAPSGKRAVTSVSAEGQSISYEQRSQQTGVAGALPTAASIRQFKRLSVYQAPTRTRAPWPYR